jgi:hypothetical protein
VVDKTQNIDSGLQTFKMDAYANGGRGSQKVTYLLKCKIFFDFHRSSIQ